MNSEMKVVLFMGMSVNGIIASENGNEDFMSWAVWDDACHLAKKFGCLIWGRKTYDNALKIFGKRMSDLSGVKLIIVSTSKTPTSPGNYTLANSPSEAIKTLAEQGYKTVMLGGGSTLNSVFAKEGLIDEIVLDVSPAIVGNGIPLFAKEDFQINLKLLSTKRITGDLLQLRYRVIK